MRYPKKPIKSRIIHKFFTAKVELLILAGMSNLKVDAYSIPCIGTGTHDSMWGNKIRSIKDVPDFERELLLKLIKTGIVKSIKFLDFYGQYSSSSYPFIEIKEIIPGDRGDIIMGVLRGSGRKQNAQRICIEVLPGSGELIKDSFTSEINIENLETLITYAAASNEVDEK